MHHAQGRPSLDELQTGPHLSVDHAPEALLVLQADLIIPRQDPLPAVKPARLEADLIRKQGDPHTGAVELQHTVPKPGSCLVERP